MVLTQDRASTLCLLSRAGMWIHKFWLGALGARNEQGMSEGSEYMAEQCSYIPNGYPPELPSLLLLLLQPKQVRQIRPEFGTNLGFPINDESNARRTEW